MRTHSTYPHQSSVTRPMMRICLAFGVGAFVCLPGNSPAFGSRPARDLTITWWLFQSQEPSRLVAVAKDGRFGVWNTQNWARLAKGQLPIDWVTGCTWSPSGSRLYFRDRSSNLVLYSITQRRVERRAPSPASTTIDPQYVSPNGRFLLCWDSSISGSFVTVRDAKSLRLLDQWKAASPGYWHPKGNHILFGVGKSTIQVPWPRRHQQPRALAPPGYEVDWSPDGSQLAIINNKDVALLARGKQKWRAKGVVPGASPYVYWHPNGQLLYAKGYRQPKAGEVGMVPIVLALRAADGKIVGKREDDFRTSIALRKSPYLVRGDTSHTVAVIDSRSGTQVTRLQFGR